MSVAVVAGCRGCGASRFQVRFDLYRTAYCVGCAKAKRKKPRRIDALKAARASGNVPPPEDTLSAVFTTGEARERQRQAERDQDAMERWAARGFASG